MKINRINRDSDHLFNKNFLINQATTLLIMLLLLPAVAFAGPGTTGANFMRIEPGARQAAMGGVGTGLADDVNANYYNPAGLHSLKGMSLGLMHLVYLEGITYEYFSLSANLNNETSLGWYAIYLNSGKMDQTTEDSTGTSYTKIGTFDYQNLLVGMSLSRKIYGGISFGMVVKIISDQAPDDSLLGLAADFGLLLIRDIYRIGISINNLGPSFGFGGSNPMPLEGRAGASLTLSFLTKNDLILGADFIYPMDTAKIKEHLGGEFWLFNLLAGRIGYRLGEDLQDLSYGAGFKIGSKGWNMQLDYTYIPTKEGFNVTHRASISFHFL